MTRALSALSQILCVLLAFEVYYTVALKNLTILHGDKGVVYSPPYDWSLLDGGGKDGMYREIIGNVTSAATFNFTGIALYYMAPRWISQNVTTQIVLDQGQTFIVYLQSTEPYSYPASAKTGGTFENVENTFALFDNLTNDIHFVTVSPVRDKPQGAIFDAFLYTVVDKEDPPPSAESQVSAEIRKITIALIVLAPLFGLVLVYILWRCIVKKKPVVIPLQLPPTQQGPVIREQKAPELKLDGGDRKGR